MKLAIELVPSTSWYNNLRSLMSKTEWDKVRKETYAKYEHKCGICKKNSHQFHCHEIWKYDDHNYKQKLVGFISLCTLCHHVKHIGLAGILAAKGKLDYEKVVDHFIEVNKCLRCDFEKHKKQAFVLWKKRSKHKWEVDAGKYSL